MEKTTEDYCSYEIAKLIKENGFEGEVSAFVEEDNTKYDYTLSGFIKAETLPCPTHQMAMKWLREKQGIIITVDYDEDEDCKDNERYGFTIYQKYTRKVDLATFPTYENAVEAALKYCLTYMI
jgi:hypothetical protein